MLSTEGKPQLCREATDLALGNEDRIDLLDRLERDRGSDDWLFAARLRCDVGQYEELPASVRPTRGLRDGAGGAAILVESVEACVGVGLQDAAIMGEMTLGMLAGPVAGEEIDGRRRIGSAERLVVADVGP